MSQLPLFGGSAPPDPQAETVSESKTKAKARSSQPKQSNPATSVLKRIASPAVPVQVNAQSEEKPAPYGLCRICSSPIAIPGLDASLCSNPIRTCGSSGWVTDPQWRATHSEPKGGKA